MAKHKHNEPAAEAAETVTETAAETAVEVEQPKEKVGDKPEASTTVDSEAKAKRTAIPKDRSTYRILSGVDASKFNGQRQSVVKALQKLAAAEGEDKSFSLESIVANVEGLVSKTPVEASVLYHLKGLVGNAQVEVTVVPKPEAKKEEKKEEAAA